MFDAFLVPENTVVTTKGDGAAVDVAALGNRTLLLLLRIAQANEQQSLDLTVWGSPDGQTWSAKPLASFPQKFYTGEQPLLLDLAAAPDTKFIRAHWEVNRWGRGPEAPSFEVSVRVTEVSPELLR
jgi:hypothetical protein